MVIGTLALPLIFLCDFYCEQGSGPGGAGGDIVLFGDSCQLPLKLGDKSQNITTTAWLETFDL